MRFAQFVAATGLALFCVIAPAHADKRVALVVGNGAYLHSDRLANPVNDARGMRDALKKLGFDVIHGEDIDQRGLSQLIIQFAYRVEDADVAMVYFAGRGATLRDMPYVVPVDASMSLFPDELVPVETLIRVLRRAKGVRIVILDADGLAPIKDATGLIIAYATQYRVTTAADGDNSRSSPFTAALLNNIATPGVNVADMFRKVEREVVAATGGRQRPEISAPMYEQYALVPAGFPPGSEAALVWRNIQNTTSLAVLDDFIRQFGDAPIYGALARARREELAQLVLTRPPLLPSEPPSQRPPTILPPLPPPGDSHIVEFLFATTRKQISSRTRKKISSEPVHFGGERGEIVYGAARVRVPEEHHIGRIELPGYTLWSLVGYESKADEKKHFVIRSVVRLPEDDWKHYITQVGTHEALVFVHGYHTSFEDALYRNAQIIFDLQYKRGISVLFSWASKGNILDYVYDTNSALNARAGFLRVLRALRSAGVAKIHVLAHSMGNLVVLEALAQEARTSDPLNIAQLIMAAPDVDYDAFRQLAPEVRRITQGMTLYASSADKAMDASRALAKVQRAGDVTAAGPIILPDIDTIDVTPVGQELFGLNHDTFATGRSVLSDVSRIVLDGLRPPDARLPVEIQPMPEGALQPKFWRYRESNAAAGARYREARPPTCLPSALLSTAASRTPLRLSCSATSLSARAVHGVEVHGAQQPQVTVDVVERDVERFRRPIVLRPLRFLLGRDLRQQLASHSGRRSAERLDELLVSEAGTEAIGG